MGDCCSNCGRKKCMAFMVMLFCSFVLLLMQNVDVMAGELWSGAEVSIEGPIMIDLGQTVTCNMRVKNTSTVERYIELHNWYYRESDNSETYPGTEFGTLLDSEGKKVTKTVHFSAGEEKTFTLIGIIPDTWGEKSEILVVAMGVSTEGSVFLGQGSYKAYLNNPDDANVPYIELPVPEITEVGNSGKGVDVTWICAKNGNIDGFYIYRSKDGQSWEEISKIQDAEAVEYRDKDVSDGGRCGYMVCSYRGSEKSENSVPEYTYFLKRVSISSVKSNAVGKIKVKWRTCSYASGYQIRLGRTKSFTKETADVITVKGRAKALKTISKLRRGKKYYVQVRAYRTYNGDGYYSEWSSVKSVKVMK